MDEIVSVITSTLAPETWDEVGGYGSCSTFRLRKQPTLVISQTLDIHEQIERLLSQIRKSRVAERELNPAVTEVADPAKTIRSIAGFRSSPCSSN